jgi:small subunit ribosomal protein S14
MAKKCMVQREKKRLKLVSKYLKKRTFLLEQVRTPKNFSQQLELQAKLQALPRNSSPIRVRNRCWKTGRPRGFFRDFGLSRHVLREMAHECLLPGVTKSSW